MYLKTLDQSGLAGFIPIRRQVGGVTQTFPMRVKEERGKVREQYEDYKKEVNKERQENLEALYNSRRESSPYIKRPPPRDYYSEYDEIDLFTSPNIIDQDPNIFDIGAKKSEGPNLEKDYSEKEYQTILSSIPEELKGFIPEKPVDTAFKGMRGLVLNLVGDRIFSGGGNLLSGVASLIGKEDVGVKDIFSAVAPGMLGMLVGGPIGGLLSLIVSFIFDGIFGDEKDTGREREGPDFKGPLGSIAGKDSLLEELNIADLTAEQIIGGNQEGLLGMPEFSDFDEGDSGFPPDLDTLTGIGGEPDASTGDPLGGNEGSDFNGFSQGGYVGGLYSI